MATVGGDLATLANLFRSLGQNADQIVAVKQSIDNAMQGTVWTGANSEKFREAWAAFSPTLDQKLAPAIREAQSDIQKQARNIAAATGEAAPI